MRANITKDAGVYRVTDARTPTMAKQPRSRTIALTDCVCYDRDGNVINVIPRTARTTRTTRTTRRTTTAPTPAARRDIILQATMGSIHEGDI